MSLTPATLGIGSCTELKITIDNAASALPATGLSITLNLPDGVSLANPAGASTDCRGSTLTANDGGSTVALAGGMVGAGATCTITTNLTLSLPGSLSLISSDLTSSLGNSGSATTTIGTPPEGPVLGVRKQFSPELVPLGGRSTLRYTLENQAGLDAANITFTDMLPTGIAIATPPNVTTTCEGIQITAVNGTQLIEVSPSSPAHTLLAGRSCTLTIDVVGVVVGDNLSRSENLTSTNQGGPPTSAGLACAQLEVVDPSQIADVSFTKEFIDDPIAPGGTGILEFTITNNSPGDTLTNLNFTDDLEKTLPGLVAAEIPTGGGTILEATFDSAGTPPIITADWDYLDRLENENGANHGYPVDGSGNAWNSIAFDPGSSTIGPWESEPAPLQAGLVDGFPGAPDVLFGIDAAANGENLITTYLFRNTFDLTAEQLAEPDWLIEYLIDDGAVVFINGTEVFRTPSMPNGIVTPTTFSGLGEESNFATGSVDLSGILVEGSNTIAVEVHQTALDSSDIGFQIQLLPGSESPTGGFSYEDDPFQDAANDDASDGTLEAGGGFSGGGLRVQTGGQNFIAGFFTPQSSGGWSRTFNLDEAATATINLRYRLFVDGDYDNNEYGEAVLTVDGQRQGFDQNNSLLRFSGDDTDLDADSGWRTATVQIALSAGDHTLIIGAYTNQTNSANETTRAWFDDVTIDVPQTVAEPCGPGSRLAGASLVSLTGGSLGPGQSCTFSVNVTVPVTTPTGSYLNTTSALHTEIAQAPMIGLPASDTLVVETIPPAFAAEFVPNAVGSGGTSTLTFTIDNSASALDATAIDFTGALPAGVSFVAPLNASTTCALATVDGDVDTGVFSFTGGSIPAGASCTVSFAVTSSTPGAHLTTTSDLSSSLGTGGAASASLSVIPPPAFSLTFLPASLNAGQVGTMTYTIDNTGSALNATNVNFSNSLPAGLVLSNPVNLQSTCVGGSVSAGPGAGSFSYSGGTVPAGTRCSLTVEIISTAGGTFVNNTGELTSSLGNSGSAAGTLQVNPIVSVSLSKSESADPVVAGSGAGNLRYTITATNNGPSTATGVTVTEALTVPAGVTVDSITPSAGTYSDPTWEIGTLDSGSSATLTVVLTVSPTAAAGVDIISDTATLATVNETNIANGGTTASAATSVITRADLQVTNTASEDPVVAGSGAENLQYLVTVTNHGPSFASGVTLSDLLTLPPGVTAASTEVQAGTTLDDGTWTIGNLAVGSTVILRLNLTVEAAAAPGTDLIVNAASIASIDQTDINPQNNTVTTRTSVSNEFDLALSETESVDPVIAGSGSGNLVYLVTASNTGPSSAGSIQIREALTFPAGVTIESITPSAGTYLPANDPNGTWNLALPTGRSETLTITLTIAGDAPHESTITNTATIEEFAGTDTDASNNSTTESTTLLSGVELVVEVAESRDPVLAGFELPGNLRHTVTLTNKGPGDASGVSVDLKQILPAGVTIASGSDSIWLAGSVARGTPATYEIILNVPASVPGGVDTITTTATVTSANEAILNPGDSASESTSVISPASVTIDSSGKIELDLQTALFKQTITITNNNALPVPAFRLLVDGLPGDVSVHNAQGTSGDRSFLLYNQELAPGESVDLIVEYFQADASGEFEPSFELELLDATELVASTEGASLNRIESLPNGDKLLEFSSTPGETYVIQYTHDGENWFNVAPSVIAAASATQWIDNGPPKTPSHPSTMTGRLYRVVNPANDDE